MSTFPLFNSFPAEIHALILSSCEDNDRVCLSLTCKYLYDLNPIKQHVPLDNIDTAWPLCCNLTLTPLVHGNWWNRYRHNRECHAASYAEMAKRNARQALPPPQAKKRCTTSREASHCECFSRRFRLYKRLRTWTPKGLCYCGQCGKFTRRRKQDKGRCFHGQRRSRRFEGNSWTHRPRKGAFGRGLWKKWFNNAAMNRLETQLRGERPRKGTGRYDLRTLEPKDVDTRGGRCGVGA